MGSLLVLCGRKNDIIIHMTKNNGGAPENQARRQVRINYFIIAVFALMAGIAIGFNKVAIVDFITGQKLEKEADWSLLSRVYDRIQKDYDGEVDLDKLVEGSVKGLVQGLGDPHSSYMTREEAERFKEQLTGNIGGGIGAEIGLRDGNITIVRPLKNNPAVKAGIESGDVIIAVNDEDVTSQELESVILKIRGPVNTTVKLKLVRQGLPEPFEVDVVRAEVNNPSVELSYHNKIAIIKISRFDGKTAGLMKKAAHDLKLVGAKGVIVDLRDNSGGVLTAAQSVAGLWISGETVVIEQRFDKIVDTLTSPFDQAELANLPTVLLVNENSASASEILAAALKDYDKATIVGNKTYGKGSVQELVNISGGGQLKLTIAHWYTSKNKTIEGNGITPDIEVTRTLADEKANKDPQIDKAMAFLEARL